MPENPRVNLAKALKLKNRLAGQIAKLDASIKAYNSVPEGREQLDVQRMREVRLGLVGQLIDLKVAIAAANQPIQRLIYQLAEHKAEAQLLSTMSTQHGKAVEGYAGSLVNYVAQLRKETVDREIRRLEREVDRIQDQLDTFNFETTIAVDPILLAEEDTTSAQ